MEQQEVIRLETTGTSMLTKQLRDLEAPIHLDAIIKSQLFSGNK